MSGTRWWLYRNESVSDRPYTPEQLARMDLQEDTLVCPEGQETWYKLATIDELAPVLEDNGVADYPPLTLPEKYSEMVEELEGADLIMDEGLYITKLKEIDEGWKVTFNRTLTILGVEIHEDNVEWPKEEEGSRFPIVKFSNSRIEEAVETALQNGAIQDSDEVPHPMVEIARTNDFSSGKLKGFFDIRFQEVMAVEGFKLMESNDGDGYWVGLPSIQIGDDWVDQVEMDKGLKNDLATKAERVLI